MTEQERQERMEKMIKKMLDKSEVILQAGKPHEITKRSDKMWSPVCDVFKEEQTNEEWFCGLSTEEKAKWMAKHMSFCEVCEIQTCRGDGCQRFDRGSMTETDAFREWLKEKHTIKE